MKISSLAFLLLVSVSLAHAAYPAPTNYVNDEVGVLDEYELSKLNELALLLKENSTVEFAVLIVNSTRPEDVNSYAEGVFREWGVGAKGKDNGILTIVAVGDRKTRIEVGYGLEHIVTDIDAKRIITENMTPLFAEGRYYEGVLGEMGEVVQLMIAKNYDAEAQPKGEDDYLTWVIVAVLVIIIIWIILSGIKRRGDGTRMAPILIGGMGSFGGRSGGFGGFGGGRSGGGGANGGW